MNIIAHYVKMMLGFFPPEQFLAKNAPSDNKYLVENMKYILFNTGPVLLLS